MKRRASQERDEVDARTQADARREALLAQLRDRETSKRDGPVGPMPDAAPVEPESVPDPDGSADELAP
ncbi:MAG: hypothetical protein OEW24_03750 [Chloroflexota bacterium]|nr:hypothetical protein [Chloroflexota bacterium]